MATGQSGGDWPYSLSFLSGQVQMLSVKLPLDWFKLPGGHQIPNQTVSIRKRGGSEGAGGKERERKGGGMCK